MTSPRSRQEGSIGVVVVLAVVVAVVWWQWDTISGWFGGKPVADLLDYQCVRDGRVAVDGRVRNISDAPVELRAVTAILDSSGQRSDYSEAVVRPVPLPPGQVGDFRSSGSALPDGGSCRLDSFVDSATGKPVAYTGRVSH